MYKFLTIIFLILMLPVLGIPYLYMQEKYTDNWILIEGMDSVRKCFKDSNNKKNCKEAKINIEKIK